MPGYETIPYNDLDALEESFKDKNVCGVVAYSSGKNIEETFTSAAESAGKVSAKISRKLKN